MVKLKKFIDISNCCILKIHELKLINYRNFRKLANIPI